MGLEFRIGKTETNCRHPSRRGVLGGLLAVTGAAGLSGFGIFAPRPAAAARPRMIVYRDPNCGCCLAWVRIMMNNGFDVRVANIDDLTAIKEKVGVPLDLAGCHTALVDGYVIDGHVPPESVKRLLAERPNVTGIAVPGMPAGSPGMGGPRTAPLEFFAFTIQGSRTLFYSFD